MTLTLTPSGETCVITRDHIASKIIFSSAKGGWQMSVARNLIENGYIIGYKADGGILRGKARSYTSKYTKSLNNLIKRIGNSLEENNIDLCILAGAVGPNGAFGYYLR